MMEISNTFMDETSKVIETLDTFNDNINTVVHNSQDIRNKTQYLTNELHVSNGKIDHIALKLQGYKAIINNTSTNIADENSCRFGKWFSQAAHDFLKGNSHVSVITQHHNTVHQQLKHAIEAYNSGKKQEALEAMKQVEHASEVGFEELLTAVKESAK
jgi:hypothetical protein